MSSNNRIEYSLKNAKVSLFFYFAILVANLFSRKIFLEGLGDTLSGLTTTMQFTVGLLNMADVGIVTAISCALFKPIFENDRHEIQRIISLFCFLFRIVGFVIIGIGAVLLFLFPYFLKTEVDTLTVSVSFLTFLSTTSLSYFVNYKQQLLLASQRTYVVTTIQNTVLLLKIAVQVAVVKYISEETYYVWLATEVVFAVLFSILLERRVKREYPWLAPSFKEGKRIRKEYRELFKSLRQIVSHKFAAVVLTQTDSIVIAGFISLVSVTYYYNYTMIISKLLTFVNSMFSGSWAGVGNLISEGNKSKTLYVFRQYNASILFIAGVLVLCVFLLADPFIKVWIGEEYVLGGNIFAIMVVTLYISLLRIPLSVFLNGYVLYQDSWSAWVEATLNLAISIIGSIHFGLIGVVAGTAISTGIVTLLWKPYFLYKNGFKESVGGYYKEIARYIFPAAIVFIGLRFSASGIINEQCTTMFRFFVIAAITLVVVTILYGAVSLALNKPLRSVAKIVYSRLFKLR